MSQTLAADVEAGSFPHYQVAYAETDWAAGLETTTLTMAQVQHRWGELFLFTQRLREAKFCLEEACRLNPNFGAAWEARGIAALLEEEHDDALAGG